MPNGSLPLTRLPHHESFTDQAVSICLPLLCTGSQVGTEVGPRAVGVERSIYNCNQASKLKG